MAIDRDSIAATSPPSSASEIAETIDRDDNRLLKRGYVKSGRKVRQVMFNVMNLT